MKPMLIDLFSGCGGVTQGFKDGGYRVLSAVEMDPIVAQTYRENHPEVVLCVEDIRKVDPKGMMKRCGLRPGELTVLSACAPCQPFSRQTRTEKKDEQTKLVLEMIRFVAVLRPQFAIMENVPGLNKGRNKRILDKLVKVLRDNLDYNVLDPHIVNTANYGVPQFRKRLILLCSRDDVPLSMPEESHVPPEEARRNGKEEWLTVRDAFCDIHRLASGQKSRTDPLHRARKHTQLNLERLRHIPKNGGSRHSLPEHLQLACHKRRTGYNDVYGRMDFNRPANTLTTGCTNFTKGRFAHPTANRAITLREAARLQTFPDFYRFVGGYDQISAQIGNAVPVLLTKVFAEYFYRLWERGVDQVD
jgi:DNA (cytosine-5)-methyltransferase 1